MNPSRSRSLVHVFMLFTVLIALVGSAVFVTPAYAASIVVDSNADTVADDGTCTLREAINNANADSDTSAADCTAGSGNDTITFADALAPITLGSALPAISDTAGLTINGGTDITVSGNSLYQVFYVNSGVALTLNGLTVSNGAGVTQGAGAYNAGGTLTILGSTFSNNSSTGTVGDQGGGGVYNTGTLVVTNSIFSGNSAAGSTNQHGGGIYNSSGTLTIDNSTFSGNTATDGGGAVFANAGTSSITHSIFSSNIASGTGGGALYYLAAPLSITTSTFSSNSAPSGYGGGIWSGASTISITNSTFSSNSASVAAYGGGIFATGAGTTTIRNSTFSGNTGVNGGGVTVAQGSLNLYNTLIANSSGGHDCLRIIGGTVSGNNNLIEGSGADACDLTNGTSGNIIGSDPNLGTLTGSPAYFPLNSGSLAINAGDDTVCALPSSVNNESQNGVTRPSGLHCDIGSFEALRYMISGNAGVTGATLSYDDGGAQTATADGSGDYAFDVTTGWSGTVTPSFTDTTFTPASLLYTNVTSDQTDQDYRRLFSAISKWTSSFDQSHGWSVSQYVRTVGDVDGDGTDDLVGFGQDGVYVALSTGSGFGSISKWTSAFDLSHGWTVSDYVRTVGDVDGDGMDDLVGFGQDGVYVAISTGSGFDPIEQWSSEFDLSHGWTVSDYVRTVGDADGDDLVDLVGFGQDGVYVALSTGTCFCPMSQWTTDFDLSHGWTVSQYVRTVGDLNGDGMADLVGYGQDGVYVALSTGTDFAPISKWTSDFDLSHGWTVSQYVRVVGDVNGDGLDDLVGFGQDGVYVAK